MLVLCLTGLLFWFGCFFEFCEQIWRWGGDWSYVASRTDRMIQTRQSCLGEISQQSESALTGKKRLSRRRASIFTPQRSEMAHYHSSALGLLFCPSNLRHRQSHVTATRRANCDMSSSTHILLLLACAVCWRLETVPSISALPHKPKNGNLSIPTTIKTNDHLLASHVQPSRTNETEEPSPAVEQAAVVSRTDEIGRADPNQRG